MNTETPVVVLNTHYSGLAIARDLAPLGVRVVGVTAHREFPGNWSRYIEYRDAPDSLEAPEALLAFLLHLAQELGQRPLLLPTRDHDINFINGARAALEQHYRIGLAPALELDRILNKSALSAAAAAAGVRVPESVTVLSAADVVSAKSLQFPCICKPVYASQWRQPGIWEAVGRQKARRVETFEDLQEFYRSFSHLDARITVQEWVDGAEENLLIFGAYCNERSEVVCSFTARKRLQYPPLSGTGIVVEALPLPELLAPSAALLSALAFRGICEVEYKRDARDGQLYLIEVNPRHWDQHGLGTAVGVNLSEAMYRDLTGQPVRTMMQAHTETRWFAESEFSRQMLRAFLGRVDWRVFLLPFGCARVCATYDRSDIRPFFSLFFPIRSAKQMPRAPAVESRATGTL
jgi:predicted ATP-grasp superfamily ATP-dependent carboligase